MNIFLLDLNHGTRGIHTNTVPLGIGLIKQYILKNSKYHYNILLFKTYEDFIKKLDDVVPDVVGIAQYCWNSNLNLYAVNKIKERNKDCVVIAGGPNLPTNYESRYSYIYENKDLIDLCVCYDGEIPFFEIVESLSNGLSLDDVKNKHIDGVFYLNDNNLFESNVFPRVNSLDVFGTPFIDGVFDEFLDDGFRPFMQTQRGCPFKCGYCNTSDKYHSKIVFQSVELFQKEIEYVAKRNNGNDVMLTLSNNNFGLFDCDYDIARVIRNMQDKYDFPKHLDLNYYNKPERVIELFKIWKNPMLPKLSVQSLTDDVLKNINRRNIDFDGFVAFQKYFVKERGIRTSTEFIVGLPGETKESFFNCVSRVLDAGVQRVIIYTLMLLRGTDLYSDSYRDKYGFVTKFRLVYGCFSRFGNDKVFDIEEVVVANNSLSFNDYLDIRSLNLSLAVFSGSSKLFNIRKFLVDNDIKLSEFIFEIHNNIMNYEKLKNVYDDYVSETKDELFDSVDELVVFFSKDENFDLLLDGSLGDKLIKKYKDILLKECFYDVVDVALYSFNNLLNKYFERKTNKL